MTYLWVRATQANEVCVCVHVYPDRVLPDVCSNLIKPEAVATVLYNPQGNRWPSFKHINEIYKHS